MTTSADVDFYEQTFIGRTLFRHAEGRIAKLRPIAVAHHSRWELIDDPVPFFPGDGNVFCTEPAAVGRPDGVYFTFKVIQNDGPDRYRAVEIEEACEVLRDFGRRSPDDQRRIAVLDGFHRGQQRSAQIVLPLKGNRYVLPRLTEKEPNLWIVAHNEDLARIPVYAADSVMDGGIAIEQNRFFVLPGHIPVKRVGLLNWQMDGDFLETVLAYLRRDTRKTVDPALEGLTKGAIGRMRTALTTGAPLADQADEADSIRERLSSFLPALQNLRQGGAQIAECLLAYPFVKTEIQSLSQAEMDRMRSEALSEIRWQVTKQVEEEITAQRNEIAALEEKAASLNASIAIEESRLQSTRQSRTTELATLRASIDGFLDKVASADGALARIRAVAGWNQSVMHDAANFCWNEAEGSTASFELEELPCRLLGVAETCMLSADCLIALDIAVRAGDMPILAGAGRERLLSSYVRTVAAGVLWRQAFDPAILGPDDLMIRPGSSDATPLARAWVSAKKWPSKPQVVCIGPLEGTTLPLWFLSFAELYRSCRPSNLMVLTMLSENTTQVENGIVIDVRGERIAAEILLRGQLKEAFSAQLKMKERKLIYPPIGNDAIARFPEAIRDERSAAIARDRCLAASVWRERHPAVLDKVLSWSAAEASERSVAISTGHFDLDTLTLGEHRD